MIKIENNKVSSSEGKFVHRLGTEHYGRVMTLLLDESVESFEETDTVPEVELPELPEP